MDSSKVDARADIYSLGATLYFLLAGRPLFPEGRTAQKLVWQQIKEPVPIARLRPEVPAELAAVIHKMLQKRPADRFQTVTEVFDALEPFDTGDVPPPNPLWMPEEPARVALGRGAPNPAARGGGGSHIVVAAMRTGGSSAALRKDRGSDSASDSAKVVVAPTPPARTSPYDEPTRSARDDDTHPRYRPEPEEEPEPEPRRPANPTALLVTLSVALVLALMGIVILLLRK